VQALADRHLPWQRAIANAYRLYGQRKERREMELLTLSPEERYRGFVRDHPELALTLKQRDIASYVRVTPVALSRIKARLR
jgi:CRP-like cAMP-binding protein